MLSSHDRYTVAIAYLQAAQLLVAKMQSSQAQTVLKFLEESCQLISPGEQYDFRPGVNLSSKFNGIYLAWVYVFDQHDLAKLSFNCRKNLGLEDTRQMGMYYLPNRFLVLNNSHYSSFMKGLWILHEGFHAWSHQVMGHNGTEGCEFHEHEAHELDQVVLNEYGGSLYQTLLRYRIEELRKELRGRSLLERPQFQEPPYLFALDQIMGSFTEPFEMEIRKRLLHRHAVYTLVWELDLPHTEKIQLLNSLL